MIGLQSNFIILNMSTQFIMSFIVQPILIVTYTTLCFLFPHVKRFRANFEDYFWNGFISALNGNV